MNLFQALILGIVEGITEYLPISSTGHLILASAALGLDTPASAGSVKTFEIVIQGGAILAVLGLYRARFVQMLRGLIGRDGDGLRLFVNLAIAFLPAALLGFVFKDVIRTYLMNPSTVATAFMVGGVYMIAVEFMRARDHALFREQTLRTFGAPEGVSIERLTPLQALFIGGLQCVALIPGVSRSMMTITGGLFVRLTPRAAAEFSFLLGMPTLLAATAYAGAKDVLAARASGGPSFVQALGVAPVVLGVVSAAVCAALAVKWLVGALSRFGLVPFGVYRILVGAVIVLSVRMGWMGG